TQHHIHPLFIINTPPTTQIYTLSLHDALPIFSIYPPILPHSAQLSSNKATSYQNASDSHSMCYEVIPRYDFCGHNGNRSEELLRDRKSTRLNSSHVAISYAVFCLKKKKKEKIV